MAHTHRAGGTLNVTNRETWGQTELCHSFEKGEKSVDHMMSSCQSLLRWCSFWHWGCWGYSKRCRELCGSRGVAIGTFKVGRGQLFETEPHLVAMADLELTG